MKLLNLVVCVVVATALLVPASTGWAQQKFPLRQGEWTATMPDPSSPSKPMTLNFCLNDQTWTRALNQNPICAISNLQISATGLSYNLTCSGKGMQMSGTGSFKFDGMEHMTSTAATTFTVNGKPTTMNTTADYRWKQTECSPNDMNMRNVKP
jgi:hypothetical protein